MGVLAMALTLQHLPTTDHGTLAVAMALADQADAEGNKVFPSVSLVATLARLSERATQYKIRDLQEMGYLLLVKKGGGRNQPSTYKIDLVWLQQQPNLVVLLRDLKGARRAPFKETVHDQENGAPTVQKGCTNGAKRVHKRCTR